MPVSGNKVTFFFSSISHAELKETNHREIVEVTTVWAADRGEAKEGHNYTAGKTPLQNMLMCCECMCVHACADACGRKVTHGDAVPLEETENCHNLHLKRSLFLPVFASGTLFQQGGENDWGFGVFFRGDIAVK